MPDYRYSLVIKYLSFPIITFVLFKFRNISRYFCFYLCCPDLYYETLVCNLKKQIPNLSLLQTQKKTLNWKHINKKVSGRENINLLFNILHLKKQC